MNPTTTSRQPSMTPNIHDISNPNLILQLLQAQPAQPQSARGEATTAAQASARLTNDRGRYALNWDATNIGYWDWIGLFPNSQVPDDEHVDWTWIRNVKKGDYRTNQAVQPGIPWEARYFVWDYGTSEYVCIARGGLR